jgi:hypothetical protein
MTEDLNELRAKAAAFDEGIAYLEYRAEGFDQVHRDSPVITFLNVLSDARERHRQRLNATPAPQLDKDYEPKNASPRIPVELTAVQFIAFSQCGDTTTGNRCKKCVGCQLEAEYG